MKSQLALRQRFGEKAKFSLIQASFWMSIAVFTAFAVALARSKGISAVYIGVMGASYKLCAVFGQFVFGAFCDKFEANKKVFVITTCLAFLASMFFYFSDSAWTIILTYGLLGFFLVPTGSNLDTWILKRFVSDGNAYGPIRSMGSLSYAIFIFLTGILISNIGFIMMPIMLAVAVAVTLLTASATPEVEKRGAVSAEADKIEANPAQASEAEKSPEGEKSGLQNYAELFKNKSYIFLVSVLFMQGLAVFSMMQMKILVWESLGADVTTYQGIDGFAIAIAQFPVILMSSKFGGISPFKRLLVANICDLVMLTGICFTSAPQVVVLCGVLHGVGYGLLLPAMRQIIFESTSERLRTTAQGFGDAAYVSISGILGSLAAGAITDAFGVGSLLMLCVIVQIVPVSLLTYRVLADRKKALASAC